MWVLPILQTSSDVDRSRLTADVKTWRWDRSKFIQLRKIISSYVSENGGTVSLRLRLKLCPDDANLAFACAA
jgi:hypothetical protein